MTSEQSLIERIRRAVPSRSRPSGGVRLGIGDDAAVVCPSRGRECVLTCDAFLENVHFLKTLHPPESVGYKSLARATSDLAAMGATPRYFLLSLALSGSATGKWLDAFLAGLADAAKEFGLLLIGGDTSRHRLIAMNFTVVGEISPGLAVTRSGARPGDLIYVSGTLGAAQLGFELLRRKRTAGILSALSKARIALLQTHLYPSIRLSLGQMLASKRLATAMIDLSDGLSTDLARLCSASGVGARIWSGRIPAVSISAKLRRYRFDSLRFALHGGDDYELLFTAPRRFAQKIPSRHRGIRLTPIGEIIRERKLFLVGAGARATALQPLGWDSFRV